MRVLIAFFLLGTIASCSGNESKGDAATLDPNFFNLIDFVEQEKIRLENMSITKSVTVNGLTETQEIAKVNWDLELAPFKQSNIDRPGLWDSYRMDTVRQSSGRLLVTYNSLDTSNFTKNIEILFSDKTLPLDSCYSITIENGFDSFIADTRQRLVWKHGQYEVSSFQDAILSDERELNIKAVWETSYVDLLLNN